MAHIVEGERRASDVPRELGDHRGARALPGLVPAHPVGDDEDRSGREMGVLIQCTPKTRNAVADPVETMSPGLTRIRRS